MENLNRLADDNYIMETVKMLAEKAKHLTPEEWERKKLLLDIALKNCREEIFE